MSDLPPIAARRLDDYAERYQRFFAFTRRDGILHIRMHTDGGPAVFSLGLKNAFAQLWRDVGADPDTEVIIFSGTGEQWLAGVDPDSFTVMNSVADASPDVAFDVLYADGLAMIESLVFGVDVPTIGVINGDGPRKELAFFCDLTLCAPAVTIRDGNFAAGHAPPGDGMHLVLQELVGTKQAAHLLLTGQPISAARARDLGLVNEVLPNEQLIPRAWELAEQLMLAPRASRRLAHAITQRPWRQRLTNDLGFGLAHVGFGARLGLGQH